MDDETSYDYYQGAKELGIIHDWSSEDAAYTTIGATADRNAASFWNTSPNYNRWHKFTATTSQVSMQVRRGGPYGNIRRINAAIWEADGTTEVACKQYVSLGTLLGAGKLFAHGGDIGIGAMNEGACFEDLTCSNGNDYYFDGYIAEFFSGNIVYNDAAMKIVHNYLSANYNITLPAGEDIYDHDNNHGYELIGVGQEDADNYHNFAQGQGIIRIQNPSNMAYGRYITMGHNDGDVSTWVNSEVPNNDANIVRVAREWCVDKHGGDIGTIDFVIDSSDFGSYFSSYSAFVLMIDDDGDFTSGVNTIELEDAGSGLFQATGIDFSKGDYFSIARVHPSIEFSLANSKVDENEETLDIHIRLNYKSDSDVEVNYLSTNITADDSQIPVADYNSLSGRFTLPAGDTSGVITATIGNDAIGETDETFSITLSNPSLGTNLGAKTIHTVTIQDDDNTRKVQFKADSLSGSEATTPVDIMLHLTENNPTNPVAVDYELLITGTAAGSGQDYSIIAETGTVNFAVGDTLESIPTITINNDGYFENDETIIVQISNPVNANLGDKTICTYTITDNDLTPEVNYGVTSASGAESYSPVQLELTLSTVSGIDIQVDHIITGDTATGSGVDFTLNDGTVTIPAGEDSLVLLLDIFNDNEEEPNEDIEITLRNEVNAAIGHDSIFTHTIIDDDGLGWDGPGGVGNFINQIACWLRATSSPSLSDGVKVGISPNIWEDRSGNGNHAFQNNTCNQPTFWDVSATWNNRPVLEFNAAENSFLEIADNDAMNTPSGA